MKRTNVLTLLLTIIMFGCVTMPERASVEELTIRRVANVPGFSKNQLFDKSKMWLAESFVSSQDVIQYENKEEGTIIGKGSIPHYRRSGLVGPVRVGNLRFTLVINMKDDKIRVTIKDIYVMNFTYGRETPLKLDMETGKPKLENLIKDLIASFSSQQQDKTW